MDYHERFKREMIETDIAVGSDIRVTVSRDELAGRLPLVSRAASTRGAVQVLAGILLRASDGLLELEATDMELSLRTTVPATVEGEGAIVVPAKLLGDVVRLLPANEVTIAHRAEDGVASIESGAYSGRMNVFAAEVPTAIRCPPFRWRTSWSVPAAATNARTRSSATFQSNATSRSCT